MGFLKLARSQWDRLAAAGCVVLGALVLLLGWLGVSGAIYPAQQLPYVVSGGFAGLLLVAIGATLWLSADLRDEWRHLDGLESRIATRLEIDIEARVEAMVEEAVARRLDSSTATGRPSSRRRDTGAA